MLRTFSPTILSTSPCRSSSSPAAYLSVTSVCTFLILFLNQYFTSIQSNWCRYRSSGALEVNSLLFGFLNNLLVIISLLLSQKSISTSSLWFLLSSPHKENLLNKIKFIKIKNIYENTKDYILFTCTYIYTYTYVYLESQVEGISYNYYRQ
jgi:hypothetical protein